MEPDSKKAADDKAFQDVHSRTLELEKTLSTISDHDYNNLIQRVNRARLNLNARSENISTGINIMRMLTVVIFVYAFEFSLIARDLRTPVWIAFISLESAHIRYSLSSMTASPVRWVLWFMATVGYPVCAVWVVYASQCYC